MRNDIHKSHPSHHKQRPTLAGTPHTHPEKSLDDLLTWLDADVSTDLADDDLFSFNRAGKCRLHAGGCIRRNQSHVNMSIQT